MSQADEQEEIPLGYGVHAVCYNKRLIGISDSDDYEIYLNMDQLAKFVELLKREYPELGI